jgi:hypothetical protein
MSEKQDNKEPIVVEEVKGQESNKGREEKEEMMPAEHVEINEELDAELEKMLLTNPSEGLSNAQVEERLIQFGRNGSFITLNFDRNPRTKIKPPTKVPLILYGLNLIPVGNRGHYRGRT